MEARYDPKSSANHPNQPVVRNTPLGLLEVSHDVQFLVDLSNGKP